MALEVGERYEGLEGYKALHFEREYQRVFLVKDSAGAKISPQDARTASGVPVLGSTYTDVLGGADPSAFCVRITHAPLSGEAVGKAWLITCHFQSFPKSQQQNPNRDPSTLNSNPLSRPPDWEFYTEGRSQMIERAYAFVDQSGNEFLDQPVCNSAGDAMEWEGEEKFVALRYERNEALSTWQTDPVNWIKWVDALNDATFLGGAAKTWRILDIRAVKVFEAATEGSGGSTYMRVTYILAYKEKGWDDYLLDHGPNYKNTEGKKVRAVDDKNNVLGFVPLDGQGKELPQSQVDARNFKFRQYRRFKPRTFASIPGGAITLT